MQVQCQPAGWLVRYFGAVCEWTTVSVGKTVSKPNYVQHSVNGLSTTTLCLCAVQCGVIRSVLIAPSVSSICNKHLQSARQINLMMEVGNVHI